VKNIVSENIYNYSLNYNQDAVYNALVLFNLTVVVKDINHGKVQI